MPYDVKIPGQISEFQLKAIELIAENIVSGTTILELGSLFGRSSYAWAKSSEGRSNVVCIDPFKGNEGVRNLAVKHGITYSRETFDSYTSDCRNIEVIEGYSPQDVEGWWDKPIHLYFDDSVHQNPTFVNNLNFWSQFLVNGGIYSGDDYRPRFNDIISEVDNLAESRDGKLIVVDFMWVVLPNNSDLFNLDYLHKGLAELSKEASSARSKFSNIHAEGEIISEIRGEAVDISLRFSNPSTESINIECFQAGKSLDFEFDRDIPLTFDLPAVIRVSGRSSSSIVMCVAGSKSNVWQEILLYAS